MALNYLTPAEAAVIAKKNRETITLALRVGDLRGKQAKKNGRWLIREADLEAYLGAAA